MIESEVYPKINPLDLDPRVVAEFKKTKSEVKLQSILHWTEHCTECAMPDCFKTCDLYVPRVDGKCQRFVHGIEHAVEDDVRLSKIQFKQWGVYATQANVQLFDSKSIEDQEKRDHWIAQGIHGPWPGALKKKLISKRYSVKKKELLKKVEITTYPDAFIIETFHPGEASLFFDVTFRNDHEMYRKLPFQYRFEVKPGYNKEEIPFDEIAKRVKIDLPFRIGMMPEESSPVQPIYFGICDFVQFKSRSGTTQPSKKVKCVVWDLDNTMWDGVLIEDGVEKLTLKKGIRDILQTIEDRGIINSIASKNHEDHAMEALEHFGLKDFFIYPMINWGPKSKSLKDIANSLNININTLLFVDDSIFERTEVVEMHPQVKVVDAVEYEDLLSRADMDVLVTAESKKRKEFYLNEAHRKEISADFEGEYMDFLRSCQLQLEIFSLTEEHLDRVHELAQRTNQMNFSGNRYQKEDIHAIMTNERYETMVMRCSDKFGAYGIIGFGIVDVSENKLIDLMFSCRIQSKRVEHAFMTFCLKRHLTQGDFQVSYRHTAKNKYSAQVFYDFEFELIDEKENLKALSFPSQKPIPDDGLIQVNFS